MSLPYQDLEIIDLHAHIMEPYALVPQRLFTLATLENANSMVDMCSLCDLSALNIPAITLYDEHDLPCNPLALYAKTLAPERIYAFAGLLRDLDLSKNKDMARQAEHLLKIGFDGIKMICKPNARLAFNLPIDAPMFDEFYRLLEEEQTPLLFHVGDPASFWDKGSVPDWAVENGWYYGDHLDVMPDLEGLYAEVEHMLEKHPGLNVAMAHFFFMSSDLERAGALFDRFPQLRFDLTPGSEMYTDFSENHEQARAFFIKYQDRFLFGTDNVGANGAQRAINQKEAVERVHMMRTFFEVDGQVSFWETKLNGLALPKAVCSKLYSENFRVFLREKPPALVDCASAKALCSEYLERATDEATRTVLKALEHQFS